LKHGIKSLRIEIIIWSQLTSIYCDHVVGIAKRAVESDTLNIWEQFSPKPIAEWKDPLKAIKRITKIENSSQHKF
jgi:hypothetical protein